MEKITDEKLFDYLEGKLSGAEHTLVASALSASPLLRKRAEAYQIAQQWCQSHHLQKAPDAMVANVMEGLEQGPSGSYAVGWRTSRLLVLVFGLASMGVLFYMMAVFGGSFSFSLPGGLPEAWQGQVHKLEWAGKLLSGTMLNAIAFVYAFLVLLVLDKAVLRPLFRQRMGRT